jgi:hypothetical protein
MSSGIDWSSFGAVLSQTKRKQMCVVGGKHFCFENNFKTLCVGGVLFIMGNPMYKYQKKLLQFQKSVDRFYLFYVIQAFLIKN